MSSKLTTPGLRIAALDIETTGLDATYGRMLCCCFKFNDEERVRTFKAVDYKDEPALIVDIKKAYDDLDVVVTWNGKRFDIPFINARLMIRRKEFPKTFGKPILDPTKIHMDLMYMSAKLRTRGNRMDGATKDLNWDGQQKVDCTGEDWIRAASGQEKFLNKIVKHCEADVRMTMELFEIYKPYFVRLNR